MGENQPSLTGRSPEAQPGQENALGPGMHHVGKLVSMGSSLMKRGRSTECLGAARA